MPVASERPKVNASTAAVDSDVIEPGNIAGIHGAHDQKAHSCHKQSGGSAEECQKDALCQQLPHQTLPTRSQRGADGDFLFAARRAGEQKVGDVGAGDQQDERNGAQQHKQGAAYVAHYLFLQTDHMHTEAGIALVLLADAAGDDVDVRLRLLH